MPFLMLWNGLVIMEIWSVSEPIDGNEIHIIFFRARLLHKLWADIARISQLLHFMVRFHKKRKNAVSHSFLMDFCLFLSFLNSHVSKIELLFQNQSYRSFKFGVVIQRRKSPLYILRNIFKVGFHFVSDPKLNHCIIKNYLHFLVWNDIHTSLRFAKVPSFIFGEVTVKMQEEQQVLRIISRIATDTGLYRSLISVSCEQFNDTKVL